MKEEPRSEGTRASLLGRLASSSDDPAWAEFDQVYRGFIYHIGRQMGLSEEDAKDVRQEVMADLVRKLPEFRYDPELGKFRGWLRQRVQWKVRDHARRRGREVPLPEDGMRLAEEAIEASGESGEAGGSEGFERLWEREWQAHRLELAKAAVKRRVKIESYQVFDLVVFKEFPVKEVAAHFAMTENHIYKIRHDLEAMMAEELGRLREEIP